MGWWDCGIMGGDTSWDIAGLVKEKLQPHLGILEGEDEDGFPRYHMPDDWDEADQARVRKAMDAYNTGKLLRELLARYKSWSDDQAIVRQVVGMLIISCGAKMTKAARDSILKGCKDDEWAKDDDRRRKVIKKFTALVEAYEPGKPVTMKQTGLFEKINRAMAGLDPEDAEDESDD